MTTGNVQRNGRFNVAANCSGTPTSIPMGSTFSKIWSGGDQPPLPKEYKTLKDPQTGKLRRLRLFRKRELIPHPYTCTITEHTLPLFQYETVTSGDGTPTDPYVYGKRICNAGFTIIPAFSDPWTSNDDITLLSKLHEKIWGSSFDPGVFLAEAGKGLQMISEAATKLTKSLIYARRGEYGKAWTVLGQSPRFTPPSTKKSNANIWAEYRWGWTPLLNDAYDGAVWVAHQVVKPMVFRLSARREIVWKGAPNQINSPTWSRVETHSRGQIIAYLQEQPPTSVMDAINPLSVAWELVPYSFVADWFIPIGNYLRVRGIGSTLKGKFVKTRTVRKYAFGYQPYYGNFKAAARNAILLSQDPLYKEIKINRIVTDTLTTPKPVFNGLAKAASWKHAIDSVALVVQKLKGR